MGKNKKRNGPAKPRGEESFSFENFARAWRVQNTKLTDEAKKKEQPKSIEVPNGANEFFINPYTFVPIEKASPKRDEVETGGHTGVIECRLEIQEGHPLFIPNTTNRVAEELNKKGNISEEHYKYNFYSYEDLSVNKEPLKEPPKQPVIPGSEIRGMVRNVYEQLTNSCFLITDENNLPYKRSSKAKKAGILDKETNTLFAADRYMLNNYKHSEFGTDTKAANLKLSTGDKIYFKATDKTYGKFSTKQSKAFIRNRGVENPTFKEKPGNNLEGYVLIGEGYSGKHHNSVMVKKLKPETSVDVSDDDIRRFEEVLKRYDGYQDYKKAYADKSKKYIPVFYEKVGNVIYMSPAQITKEVFENTIRKLLGTEANSEHQSCDSKLACPACRLFGMIAKNTKEGAIKGRVRFSDGKVCGKIDAKDFEDYTLPILGTPQMSATEFYLKKPEDIGDYGMWNYDYYVKYECKENSKKQTDEKTCLNDLELNPKLSGRKVYWHGKFKNRTIEKTNMNQTVRGLKKGSFIFNVYYEDLTDEELSDLKFALELGGEGIHKIGRGKPIGMGDVKVSINSIRERRYKSMEDGTIEAILSNDMKNEIKNTEKETKYILKHTKPMGKDEDGKPREEKVAYPSNKGGDKIFEWFSQNRGSSIQKPSIIQTLPDIMNEKQELEKYIKKK